MSGCKIITCVNQSDDKKLKIAEPLSYNAKIGQIYPMRDDPRTWIIESIEEHE
jgi:hypothetical protein